MAQFSGTCLGEHAGQRAGQPGLNAQCPALLGGPLPPRQQGGPHASWFSAEGSVPRGDSRPHVDITPSCSLLCPTLSHPFLLFSLLTCSPGSVVPVATTAVHPLGHEDCPGRRQQGPSNLTPQLCLEPRGLTRSFCFCLFQAGETPGRRPSLAQAGRGDTPPGPRNPPWRRRMKPATLTVASSCSLVSGLGDWFPRARAGQVEKLRDCVCVWCGGRGELGGLDSFSRPRRRPGV